MSWIERASGHVGQVFCDFENKFMIDSDGLKDNWTLIEECDLDKVFRFRKGTKFESCLDWESYCLSIRGQLKLEIFNQNNIPIAKSMEVTTHLSNSLSIYFDRMKLVLERVSDAPVGIKVDRKGIMLDFAYVALKMIAMADAVEGESDELTVAKNVGQIMRSGYIVCGMTDYEPTGKYLVFG